MDLILWRHADAEDWLEGCDDLARPLTARGLKQASRISGWLDRNLPEGTRIICSPALRCRQTADALGRKYKVRPELAPDGTVAAMLEAAQWPHARQAVVIVGHQPVLGGVIAELLPFDADTFPVRKGAVWWLRTRERDGHSQTVVAAVQSPDTV